MDQEENEDEEREVEETDDSKGPDFSYLLGMPMWNLTQEKKDAIVKNRDERQQELKRLKATTKEDMWRTDLEEFLTKLDPLLSSFPQIFSSTPLWPDSADPTFSRRRRALVVSVLRRMIHLSVRSSISQQGTLVNAGDCLMSALQDR